MWRQIVQARSASTGGTSARKCQGFARRRRPVMVCSSWSAIPPNAPSHCAFSSAQPWDDGSPFLMSTAPLLAQIQNPTAERVVMKTFLDTLHLTTAVQRDAFAVEETVPLFRTQAVVVEEGTAVISYDGAGLKIIEEERTSSVSVSSALVAFPEDEAEYSNDAIVASSVTGKGLESIDEEEETKVVTVSSLDDAVPKQEGGLSDERIMTSVVTKIGKQMSDAPLRIVGWNPLHARLVHAIRTKNSLEAKQAYHECIQDKVKIKPTSLVQLFNAVVDQDPITAHRVLRHYHHVAGEPAHTAIYAKLCESIGTVPLKLEQTGQFNKMVSDLRQDLIGLDEVYRRRCYPALLASFVQQPMRRIGQMASGLYKFMVENDYDLTYGKMCHILFFSRFNRQEDFSFPTILARLVNEGYRPFPPMAIHVLQNLFPYTNVDETMLALKAIITVQSSWEPGDRYPSYRVDIGTLEHIMSAAARVRSFELNILVWDLVDLLGYEPTECMYEATMQVFVMGVRQDHHVLAVLGEMEERGFVPSRALIRSLSRSIRFSSRRVAFLRNMLTSQETEGARISVSSLNTVLSAAGELGEVDLAFATFDDFGLYGIEPNADTYSFLLEALAKSVSPFKQKNEQQRKLDAPGRMDAAAAIMSLMEESQVPFCCHCTEWYAQLLYNVGRLDAATEFLMDSLDRGDPVNNRIIFVMAKNNALAGNIEVARLLSTKTSEPFDRLERKIDEMEKRFLSADERRGRVKSGSGETEDDERTNE